MKYGEAVIDDGCIIIRVDVPGLRQSVEAAWMCGAVDTKLRVTDPLLFAKEMCRELNKESENGTTPIHTLLDKAIVAAFENGAEGIEEIGK